MAKGNVSVRVQANGVVVHRHDGADSWHDPSRKHGANPHYGVAEGLHAQIGKAALLKAAAHLSEADQAQYVEALAGKTFWIYPVKKDAKAAIKAAEELTARRDLAEFPAEWR